MEYVHGHSDREAVRLHDQATTLTGLLHQDTYYEHGEVVLEAGCGVGSQTVILAAGSPGATIVSLDISKKSLQAARVLLDKRELANVDLVRGDLYHLPFESRTFDHIFVCFVLEHLKDPLYALKRLQGVLRPGGTITVIEGDHGSAYFFPASKEATRNIQCLVDIQAAMGGNALIGRQIFSLLKNAGFQKVQVSPRMVYADANRPDLVEGFTKQTFIAMVEGVKTTAIDMKLIDEASWEAGIRDLYRTTGKDGTFCYTFFKGTGVNP